MDEWLYGSSPPWAAPVYEYTPPSYSYTPPSYDYYTPPPYVYEPPAYVYTPPVYEPPSWMASPPPYDSFYSTPTAPVYDYTVPSTTMPSWYTPYESPYSAPPAYESWTQNDPLSQYLIDSSKVDYSDPYGLVSGNGNAYNEMMNSRLDATNDVYGRLIASGADTSGMGAAQYGYTPSYADPGGFYDYYDGAAPTQSGYTPSDYGVSSDAQYFSPEVFAEAPAFNLPQNQFAAINPQFSDTVSDSYESPMASALTRSFNVEGGAGAPVSSGAGAGIVPSASGGFELQTGSGETLNLSDADTQKLLRGETTLAELAAAKEESGSERLGPNTVVTKGLSLPDAEAPYGYGPNGRPLANDPAFAAAQREIADMNEARVNQGRTFEPVPAFGASEAPPEPNPFLGKMPEFDPAKMEGTRAQYEARQADEMARAAAGVPTNQEEYAQYLADRDRYNVSNYVTPENQRSFDANLRDIMENRGGFTSQWQTVGSDRVMVNDDGTGTGINENGEPYALTAREVDQMIRNKQLNTRESGYVAATGGKGDRPGGSPKESGFKLPFKFDAKAESGKGGGGGGGGGGGDKKKKGGISPALLLGLLAALAANKGKGGAAGPAIPGRELQRAQTQYGGAGRRAGSSAQQYFTGPGVVSKANGGMLGYEFAGGGIASLGGYSDGGRLLRGPGDGVSDSIPAMIGKKQPARLADGEFVVPARIVSELGNGSTEAGARKLYAMMERIQRDRKKSVGKNKVAVNSRADKHLPK